MANFVDEFSHGTHRGGYDFQRKYEARPCRNCGVPFVPINHNQVGYCVEKPARWTAMINAAAFFNEILAAPIPRICIENPIMHKHARKLVNESYSQIVQPWMFGHAETKATCLWLKGLPYLSESKVIPPDFSRHPKGKGNGYEPRVHHESPGPDRWKNRSRTLTGIGAAMAEQWGRVLMDEAA